MCYPDGEFIVGDRDVLLGIVEDTPVWISGPQFDAWKHTQLVIYAVPGRGGGFSMEAPEGMRFLSRGPRVHRRGARVARRCAAAPGRGVRERGTASAPRRPGGGGRGGGRLPGAAGSLTPHFCDRIASPCLVGVVPY